MKYLKYFLAFLIVINFSGVKAQKIDFPIFNEQPKRGAYASFEEFIQNAPSIVDSFYLDSKFRKHQGWENTQSHKPRFVENDKKIRKIWGFSDGANLYISYHGEYFKIDITQNSLSFYSYPPTDHSGAFVAGFTGGLIGGAIYMAATANSAYEPTLYWINPFNGELKLIGSENPESILENVKGKLFIYRPSKSQIKEPIKLSVNDTLNFSLVTNSYKKLLLPLSSEKIKICFTNDSTNCLESIMDTDEYIYIEASKEKGTRPIITKVDNNRGSFHQRQIEAFEKIRERKANRKK